MAPDPISKQNLRQRFRALRSQQLNQLQDALEHRPLDLDALLDQTCDPRQHLGLSWPLAGEVDLRSWLQATGRPLALPAVARGRLVYRSWHPDQPLLPDDCGIPAPDATAQDLKPAQMALLLVPALAIDRRGVRLGYGGGWYDRLRAAPDWRRVPALVVVPSACVCEQLPCDPWDVPFDGWLDEQGDHWIAPTQPAA